MTNYYVDKTGLAHIDALLGTAKWHTQVGQGANLSYSFSSPAAASFYADYVLEAKSIVAFTEAEIQATRQALSRWSDVANIQFTEVAEGGGELRIGKSQMVTDEENAVAWAYLPSAGGAKVSFFVKDRFVSGDDAGDIWFDTEDRLSTLAGRDFFHTALHEVGHSLGLTHSFDGSSPLPALQDSYQYSVMSYTSHPQVAYIENSYRSLERLAPSTPMLYDIAAIQHLYGANEDYNSGDNHYVFSDESVMMTLWDAGGVDHLDFSALSKGVEINLSEGSHSSFGTGLGYYGDELGVLKVYDNPLYFEGALEGSYREPETYGHSLSLVDNVAIAFNAEIENLTGTRFNDRLNGNALDNYIIGGGGHDWVDGMGGDDVFAINARFEDLSIDVVITTAGERYVVVHHSQDRAYLKNIDALAVDNGYVDLRFYKPDQQRVADQEDVLSVARLYQAALDRTPDESGLNYWIGEFEDGNSMQQISQGFTASDEFRNNFNVSTAQGFVTTLYENVLDRSPDQAGLNYWLNEISNGQSYQDVLFGFSESNENKTNTVELVGAVQYDVGAGLWSVEA